MTQLLTQAADENNENLGQWSLLITTIVVRPHQPLHSKSEAFIPNWRSEDLCQLERLQPRRQAKHNSMRQTALNSSSNSCCCYIWTCQSDQEKKKKMNQTPSNWQSQIQSWMCWFQDQHEKHSLQMVVQSPTIEDGDVSTQNWKPLIVYFQVMKGEIVTQGRLLKLPSREDRMQYQQATQRLKEDNRKH